MLKLVLNDKVYTVNELSEITGIAAPTIRKRLRDGYSVEESVRDIPTHTSVTEFDESSWWEDFVGKSTKEVYDIYWGWCIKNNHKPLSHSGFTRQLFSMYPNLKGVPSRTSNGCCRIIRER